jgi:cation transport ATPase-like protein/sigma-70-like protein
MIATMGVTMGTRNDPVMTGASFHEVHVSHDPRLLCSRAPAVLPSRCPWHRRISRCARDLRSLRHRLPAYLAGHEAVQRLLPEGCRGWAKRWLFLGLIAAILQMGAFFLVLTEAGWHPGAATGPGSPLHHAYLQATTMTFLSMVMAQIGTAFAARTDRASLRSVGVFSNRWLLTGIALELALAAAIIYLPPLQDLLSTAALPPRLLLLTVPFPFIVWGADEIRRYLLRRADHRSPLATATVNNGLSTPTERNSSPRRRHRVTVYLADVEGLCHREISQMTGIPVGSVKSCLHRGRGQLRTQLASHAPVRCRPAARPSGHSPIASTGHHQPGFECATATPGRPATITRSCCGGAVVT